MLTLAINTAFAAMEAAIIRDGEIVSDAFEPMPRGMDKYLPRFVGALLEQADIKISDLERLAVVTGPGSFTGMRIGVSYVRGLGLVRDIACIGVSSLEAAVPLGMETSALAALPAKKRAPDLSWWVQGIGVDGAGIADVLEVDRATLESMLGGFKVPVFIEGADGLGLSDKIDVRPIRPSAITAGLKAERFDAEAHPPKLVYARAPDAALPKPK